MVAGFHEMWDACEEAETEQQGSECWELSACILETETHEHIVSSAAKKAGWAYGEGITGTDARQAHGDKTEQWAEKHAPTAPASGSKSTQTHMIPGGIHPDSSMWFTRCCSHKEEMSWFGTVRNVFLIISQYPTDHNMCTALSLSQKSTNCYTDN